MTIQMPHMKLHATNKELQQQQSHRLETLVEKQLGGAGGSGGGCAGKAIGRWLGL